MNASFKSTDQKQLVWPVAGILIAALARTNPFYQPQITLEIGVTAWFADVVIAVTTFWRPSTVRVGVLSAGLFLAVPCWLRDLPVFRFLLMCGMAVPFAFVSVQLIAAPTAGFRERLAYFFTWLGTRELKRRARSFDTSSLLRLILATFVFAVMMAAVKTVSPSGIGWLARWLTGGIMLLAFAEMTTAGHDFLTALLGLNAPALMRSPHLAVSLAEFWSKRWNPAASALLFGKCFYEPLVRRGVGLALFAAFFASALAHVLLLYMATKRWGNALIWGAFFLAQPPLIALERCLKVRRWRPAASRAWTLAILAITSPLLVEPVLQLIEPTWGAPNDTLLPTLRVLGIVICVNAFVAMGSFASLRDPKQPTAKPKLMADPRCLL